MHEESQKPLRYRNGWLETDCDAPGSTEYFILHARPTGLHAEHATAMCSDRSCIVHCALCIDLAGSTGHSGTA